MTKLIGVVTVFSGLLLGLAPEAAHAAKKRTPKAVTGVVNLNQATAAQLDLLPGVGEKAAQRIIEHRKRTPFTRPEDLVKVKGFGKKKFEKLKPHLAVSGPTTLAAKKEDGPGPTAQGRAAPKK
jgi:competence protein ComEA